MFRSVKNDFVKMLAILVMMTIVVTVFNVRNMYSIHGQGEGTPPKYRAFLSETIQEFDDWSIYDGELTRGISVVNVGDEEEGYGEVYVRIQLKEYMEIFDIVLDKITGDIEYFESSLSEKQLHNVLSYEHKGHVIGECAYRIHLWESGASNPTMEYIDWILGDYNIIKMSEWDGKSVGSWIIDDTVGNIAPWVYWGEALLPGQETTEFLEAIELIKQPSGSFKYSIHAEIEALSFDELVEDWPPEISDGYEEELPTTTVSVEKVWDDDNDANRPESIMVQLYKNNEAYGNVVELNEGNKWSYTWDDLKLKDTWSVEEVSIPAGYEDKVVEEYKNKFIITNIKAAPTPTPTSTPTPSPLLTSTPTPSPTPIPLYKVTHSFISGTEGKELPGEVLVLRLGDISNLSDGTYVIAETPFETSVKVVGGTWVFSGWVPKEVTIDGNDETFVGNWMFELDPTPTPIVEKVNVAGSKTWEHRDLDPKDYPKSITVIVKNGDEVVVQSEITEEEQWVWDFWLDKYDDKGNEIEYVIDEIDVEGYAKQVNGYNITNTYNASYEPTLIPTSTPIVEKVNVAGSKTWVHGDLEPKYYPKSITVIVKNGAEIVLQRDITQEDHWAWSFWLDKYDDKGNEIEYVIDEIDVEKYIKQINGYDIVNTYDNYVETNEEDIDNDEENIDEDDVGTVMSDVGTGDSNSMVKWLLCIVISMLGILIVLRKLRGSKDGIV